MIAIVDYGVGNLFSLVSSFKAIGVEAVITDEEAVIAAADKLILPGVGAFGDARRKLAETGMDKLVLREAQKGKPIMGICLGMQLLFEKSFEYGTHEGLGLLKGEVVTMEGTVPQTHKIPHIGWNSLIFKKDSPLFSKIKDGDYVYFVHSYYVKNCEDSLLAITEYGAELTAAVAKDNIYGCQFHPEKSGEVGLNILRGFAAL
ncbi:MAG: imidazole glycerol phosphate synthase subunit HisH [Ruminococcaceae bacterium]|nr:imidazole glycerol phosphate synthase subunit HisH [Oscillospiraceae bacterium]